MARQEEKGQKGRQGQKGSQGYQGSQGGQRGQMGHMGHSGSDVGTAVSPAEVERYLKGIKYPASKRDLINHLRQNRAPQDIIDMVNDIDEEHFNSPTDVTQALGDII